MLKFVRVSQIKIKDRTVPTDTQTSPIKDRVTAVLKSFDQIQHGTVDFTQSSAPTHNGFAAPNSVHDKIHEHVTQSFAKMKAEVRNQISQSFARMKHEIVHELTHELAQNFAQMMKKTVGEPPKPSEDTVIGVSQIATQVYSGIAFLSDPEPDPNGVRCYCRRFPWHCYTDPGYIPLK